MILIGPRPSRWRTRWVLAAKLHGTRSFCSQCREPLTRAEGRTGDPRCGECRLDAALAYRGLRRRHDDDLGDL